MPVRLDDEDGTPIYSGEPVEVEVPIGTSTYTVDVTIGADGLPECVLSKDDKRNIVDTVREHAIEIAKRKWENES